MSEPRALRVLLVDDSVDFAQHVRDYLEFSGFEVTVAVGGVEGLASARRERPDVVVTDLKMPGLSGRELVLALQEDDYTPFIVVASGSGDFEAREEFEQMRGCSFLRKPFRLRDLEQLLRSSPPGSRLTFFDPLE